MNLPSTRVEPAAPARFELRFESLGGSGRALAFPCDAAGHVELDALSERALSRYLYARVAIGCQFASPSIVAEAAH